MNALKSLGIMIVGFVAGIILIGLDHVFIGIIVAAAAIPVALAAWIVADD
jgi:hypothetical protein